MRHVYVNRTAYVLAALLIVSTAAFAWMRSHDLSFVMVIGADRLAEAEPRDGDAWDWRGLGERVYADACAACHSTLPHVPELAAREGGRSFLIDFMLFGFDGEAEIDGASVSFFHDPYDDLSDEQTAAVLNHMLVAWIDRDAPPDDVARFDPEEIDAARAQDLDPQEVAERRPPPD